MKKRVKILVTLLLLSAMVLAPVSAFAASDRCSSCNSYDYSVSCNANINANNAIDGQSNCNTTYPTSCNSSKGQNSTTNNCAGNSACLTCDNATCNTSCNGSTNNATCSLNNSTCNTTNNNWLTSLRGYLLKYLQEYTNSGSSALNGDNVVPVFKMNSTDDSEYILDDTYAEQVIALVNQERVAAGLEELIIDEGLCAAATIRVAEIQSLFSHTRPDGSSCFTALEDIGVQYSLAGENIAIGQASPQAVVQAWMESPGHRENILNPSFTRIGVASLANNGVNYSGYAWAQFFAN